MQKHYLQLSQRFIVCQSVYEQVDEQVFNKQRGLASLQFLI